jgi:hypothetical protein
VCRASGKREQRAHGLRDLAKLVAVAERGGVSAWLHGHRHGAYHHARPALAPFPVICAGSATQNGRWSYGEYLITGRILRGTRRIYDPQEGRFRDVAAFDLDLPG